MRQFLAVALILGGVIALLCGGLAAVGTAAAYMDRRRFGPGLMFADVEILGALTVMLSLCGLGLLCLGRKLSRRGRDEGSS